MADLTRQTILEAGLNPSFAAAAAGGDAYLNDDRTFLIVKNGGAGSITVTIAVQNAQFKIPGFGQVTFSALAIAIPAGEERWIKAPVAPYNDANGKAQITYSAVTSVTAAAVRMPGE